MFAASNTCNFDTDWRVGTDSWGGDRGWAEIGGRHGSSQFGQTVFRRFGQCRRVGQVLFLSFLVGRSVVVVAGVSAVTAGVTFTVRIVLGRLLLALKTSGFSVWARWNAFTGCCSRCRWSCWGCWVIVFVVAGRDDVLLEGEDGDEASDLVHLHVLRNSGSGLVAKGRMENLKTKHNFISFHSILILTILEHKVHLGI